MMVSAMPMVMAKNCSTTRGTMSFRRAAEENRGARSGLRRTFWASIGAPPSKSQTGSGNKKTFYHRDTKIQRRFYTKKSGGPASGLEGARRDGAQRFR